MCLSSLTALLLAACLAMPARPATSGDDAGTASCVTGADCSGTPATLVCDTSISTCVECNAQTSETAACVADRPLCGTDDACRGCRTHAECGAHACLPDGRCGTDDTVAYVSGGGSPSGTCSAAAPCTSIMTALGIQPPRQFILVTGSLDENVVINDRDVTLLAAPGAQLSKTTGSLLYVSGTSHVLVEDLQIGGSLTVQTTGATLAAGATGSLALHHVRVVNNNLGGITATGGSLSVQRSTIADNVRGGIVVRSTTTGFDLRNNFIHGNGKGSGASASMNGGILIEADCGGTVEFNTVAFNESTGVQNRSGIACYGVTNRASGNLVYGNRDGALGPDTATQKGGDCQYGTTYSLGAGDLGFENPSPLTPDFHLTTASPPTVVDAGGDCVATNPVDVDDEPRPFGSACDLGADEVTP